MMRKLLICCVLGLVSLGSGAAGRTDFATLRSMADKGTPVITDVLTNFVFAEDVTELLVTDIARNTYIEGYIVGSPSLFPRNENLEIAWQLGSKSASPKNNARTMYIESTDGKYGFRLLFDNPNDAKNAGKLFGLLELNLKGTRLVKEYNYYVITGLTADNVIGYESGKEEYLPQKRKSVAELCDDDIFTWVQVQDCEFVFKGGAWMNVRETYMVRSKTGRYAGNGWMNSWRRLVYDKQGNSLYLGLDGKLKDRRIGDGVPKGSGEVAGVLTASYMPRYGRVREYTLRPPSLEEVRFAREGDGAWKTVCGWDWNTLSKGLNPAEYGKGTLFTDCPGVIARFADCDNPSIDLPKENPASRGSYGNVDNGALCIKARSCDWWNWDTDEACGLDISFSTQGIKARTLVLAYTFAAGQFNQPTSCWYPSEWAVSCSVDGGPFVLLEGSQADLRSLPYSGGEVEGKNYETSAEAGIGYTEHIVSLPSSVQGHEIVTLRLAPRSRKAAGMGYLHRDILDISRESVHPCVVNFGEIQVRYR